MPIILIIKGAYVQIAKQEHLFNSNKKILNDKNVDEHYIYVFMETKQAQKFTQNMILSQVWSEKQIFKKIKVNKMHQRRKYLLCLFAFSVSLFQYITLFLSSPLCGNPLLPLLNVRRLICQCQSSVTVVSPG